VFVNDSSLGKVVVLSPVPGACISNEERAGFDRTEPNLTDRSGRPMVGLPTDRVMGRIIAGALSEVTEVVWKLEPPIPVAPPSLV
jgi:hypothetical protein